MRTCRAIAEVDPRYPVGRTRLETVGVILCAVIMALSSTEVVQSSLAVLWGAFAKGALQSTRSHHRLPYTLYPIPLHPSLPCTGQPLGRLTCPTAKAMIQVLAQIPQELWCCESGIP